jgi:hypothetical protein
MKVDFLKIRETGSYFIKSAINDNDLDVISINTDFQKNETYIWYKEDVKKIEKIKISITERGLLPNQKETTSIYLNLTYNELTLFKKMDIEQKVLFLESKTGISYFRVSDIIIEE